MPILMPSDTRDALGQNAERCDSRSLLLDRFVYVNPDADEARKLHLCQVCLDSFNSISQIRNSWQKILSDRNAKPRDKERAKNFLDDTQGFAARKSPVQPTKAELELIVPNRLSFLKRVGRKFFYAQLQSRLMVNMAGGVMENAGLCLDRFGMPYIPGSAVKGCARRAALAALRDWTAENQKPGNDNPLASVCAPFDTPAQMLAAIALVFGWCEQDWSDRPGQSDYRWACANNKDLLKTAAATLAAHFHWEIEERHQETPWLSLPNFAGLVSFLPAYPVDLGKTNKVDGLPCEVSALGKLELDVVTCHHPDYYQGKRQTATDDEDPNPVVFPAVAPGHVFAFALLPLPRAGLSGLQFQLEQKQFNLLELAKNWLATGLSVFGLGAKTNAGYGWFTCSDAVQTTATKLLEEKERRDREDQERQEAERNRRAQEEERRRRAEELRAATANMTPEQRLDYEIAQLTKEQFRGWLDNFLRRSLEEQQAIVRALRLPLDSPASRRSFWEELKTKAKRGGRPAQIEQAIRELSTTMYRGNERRMP